MEGLHHGESDWEVRLIDQGVSVDDVSGENLIADTNWRHISQMD